MTCYYLLRHNRELGPYTVSELKSMDLFTSDLIWINGESECWRHPDEIEGFQGLAKSPESIRNAQKGTTSPAYTASTLDTQDNASQTHVLNEPTNAEPSQEPPSFEKLKNKYERKRTPRKVWRSATNIGANLMGVVILLIGLSAAAFMIKKAVDNIEYEPVFASADAQEIGSEGRMASTTSQAAMGPNGITSPAKVDSVQETKQTPLQDTRVTLPAATIPDKKEALLTKEPSESLIQNQENSAEQSPSIEAAEDRTAIEKAAGDEAAKDEEKRLGPSDIQVAANEYKVGFLGGVSDLELSVVNPTSKAIGKAVIEVEYLKPNGKVVASQLVEVSGIGPGTTKKVPVPDNSRGVSVRYRIVTTEG